MGRSLGKKRRQGKQNMLNATTLTQTDAQTIKICL